MREWLHKIKKIVFWLLPLWVVIALFGPAGRIDIPIFWAYAAIISIGFMLSHMLIEPSLQDERLTPGGKDADKISRLVIPRLFAVVWVLAGFDAGHYHWSDVIPCWLQYVSLFLTIPFLVLMIWAMRVNRFFASALRIQNDRGHHIITTGPYQYIRHPGYLSMIFTFLFSGISLGSLAAMIPTLLIILILICRTFFEDKFLQKNLPGYAEYRNLTKYRLLPFVW